MPEEPGLKPSYEQKTIDLPAASGQFRVIASKQSAQIAVKVYQDVEISVAILKDGQKLLRPVHFGRGAWLQMVRGELTLNGFSLSAGDGAAIEDELELKIEAEQSSEILFFDLG